MIGLNGEAYDACRRATSLHDYVVDINVSGTSVIWRMAGNFGATWHCQRSAKLSLDFAGRKIALVKTLRCARGPYDSSLIISETAVIAGAGTRWSSVLDAGWRIFVLKSPWQACWSLLLPCPVAVQTRPFFYVTGQPAQASLWLRCSLLLTAHWLSGQSATLNGLYSATVLAHLSSWAAAVAI